MKVRPLANPMEGERIVGVQPKMAPQVQEGAAAPAVRHRIRFYPGRALSDIALTVEQQNRAGRLALLGQAFSPGVIHGLEVALERTGSAAFYHVAVGRGLAASGEDVKVVRNLRMDVRAVPVYAPVALLAGEAPPAGDPPLARVGEPLLPRRLGPSLGELLDEGIPLPPAGVLVLQPVVSEVAARFDPTDPCPVEPGDIAFEDWQTVDGCRLVWYAWPEEWKPLPLPGDGWRNRLAHTIFEAERLAFFGKILPWESLGVPIALVGFDDAWQPLFVDRHAVVREGGQRKARPPLVPDSGTPFLWQARIQQFIQQVAEAVATGASPETLRQEFHYLPPAGLLPRTAVEAREARNHFFPPAYTVDAVPIPLEQLELATAESASLSPFDLSVPDRVRVLVPVPQKWFDPHLLQIEAVSPEFQQAIDQFVQRRARWLRRRLDVRTVATALFQAIHGEPLTFPDPDPDALEAEAIADDGVDPSVPELAEPELPYGTQPAPQGDSSRLMVLAVEALRDYLRDQTPLKHVTVVSLQGAPQGIFPLAFPPELAGRIEYSEMGHSLIFHGRMTDQEFELLVNFGNLGEIAAFLGRLYEESQNDELSELDRLGLEKFILFLEAKVRQANDQVDLGFVRAQTNIYRLRHLMWGTLDASRLATSPALAAIATEESARTTKEGIQEYLNKVKSQTPEPDPEFLQRFLNKVKSPSSGVGFKPVGAPQPVSAVAFTSSEFLGAGTFRERERAGGGLVVDRLLREGGTLTGVTEATTVEGRVTSGGLAEKATASVEKVSERGVLFGGAEAVAGASKETIVEQPSIVGNAYDFRTVTVAERMKIPPANEAKAASVAAKFEAVVGIADLGIQVDDLVVSRPRFNAQGEEVAPARTFADYRREGFQVILDDPDPEDADEARYFAASVDVLDDLVAALRRVEGRIRQYNQAIERCRQTLAQVQALAVQADRRLATIGNRLAEARHDVAVARALLAEETQRVQAINARRDQILAEQVTFLAFHRPRLSEARLEMPTRVIDSGLREAPLPACRRRTLTPPPELRRLVSLLRQTPLLWYRRAPSLLERLGRPETLWRTVQRASLRAQQEALIVQEAPGYDPTAGGLLAGSLEKILGAQQQKVSQMMVTKAQFTVSALADLSWQQTVEQARLVLSLGDLSDADHGHADVAQEATAHLDEIAQIATCLYGHFGDVSAAIRLNWAERLSQFDAPVRLEDLSILPRWGEVDRLARREMQALVDWLYDNIDRRQPDALGLMDDLVRVCILLASHAPVHQIVAGRVQQPTRAQVGTRVKVAVQPGKVAIGTPALIYANNQVVAEAVVDDLLGGQAVTRVIKTLHANIQIDQGASVHFGGLEALQGNALTARVGF
ncbi:MAG: hypothetical protein KatS3mg050_1020 [Litorilinea sp.]|nr:MAG: hypothetical protein KatS3mg050_1020 [Litorilinea sp.]